MNGRIYPQHGDIRYLMIFAYLPTWVNGKFYFWEHYFIKQRLFLDYSYEFLSMTTTKYYFWKTIPIHIERYEYEKFMFNNK